VRDAVELHVRQTGVQLVLETRGSTHGDQILAALSEAGYDVQRIERGLR
jgi:threonine dehydratase